MAQPKPLIDCTVQEVAAAVRARLGWSEALTQSFETFVVSGKRIVRLDKESMTLLCASKSPEHAAAVGCLMAFKAAGHLSAPSPGSVMNAEADSGTPDASVAPSSVLPAKFGAGGGGESQTAVPASSFPDLFRNDFTIPHWRTKEFHAHFADKVLSERDPHEFFVQNCSSARILPSLLDHDQWFEMQAPSPLLFGRELIERLKDIAHDLRSFRTAEGLSRDPRWPGGRFCVVECGWHVPREMAHVVVCVFERSEVLTFSCDSVTICNSGDGLPEYHANDGDATGDPKKYLCAAGFKVLPESCRPGAPIFSEQKDDSAMANAAKSFWTFVGNLRISAQNERVFPEKHCGMDAIDLFYCGLLSYITGSSLHSKEAISRHLSAEHSGHLEKPQADNTCFHRAWLCALRYLLKRYGFSRLQQKEVFCILRLRWLFMVKQTLLQTQFPSFEDADVMCIDHACKHSLRAVSKLFKSSRSTVDHLRLDSFAKFAMQLCKEVTDAAIHLSERVTGFRYLCYPLSNQIVQFSSKSFEYDFSVLATFMVPLDMPPVSKSTRLCSSDDLVPDFCSKEFVGVEVPEFSHILPVLENAACACYFLDKSSQLGSVCRASQMVALLERLFFEDLKPYENVALGGCKLFDVPVQQLCNHAIDSNLRRSMLHKLEQLIRLFVKVALDNATDAMSDLKIDILYRPAISPSAEDILLTTARAFEWFVRILHLRAHSSAVPCFIDIFNELKADSPHFQTYLREQRSFQQNLSHAKFCVSSKAKVWHRSMGFLSDFLFMGIHPDNLTKVSRFCLQRNSFLYRIVEKIFENETSEFREEFKTSEEDAVPRFVCLQYNAVFQKYYDFFLFRDLDIILSLLVASPTLKRREFGAQSYPRGLNVSHRGKIDGGFFISLEHDQLPSLSRQGWTPVPLYFVNFDFIISQSRRSSSMQLVMYMQRVPHLACALALKHFADSKFVCDLVDAQVRLLFTTAVFRMGLFASEAAGVETL